MLTAEGEHKQDSQFPWRKASGRDHAQVQETTALHAGREELHFCKVALCMCIVHAWLLINEELMNAQRGPGAREVMAGIRAMSLALFRDGDCYVSPAWAWKGSGTLPASPCCRQKQPE